MIKRVVFIVVLLAVLSACAYEVCGVVWGKRIQGDTPRVVFTKGGAIAVTRNVYYRVVEDMCLCFSEKEYGRYTVVKYCKP